MRSYRQGILLTGGEISALTAFAGKDPTQEKLWGCVLKTTSLSIVASSSNGMAGLLGVDTGRHELPPGNWFIRRSDLERLKKLTTGGGMAIFVIGPSGGMRSCQMATADKETGRIIEGGFWTFQDPADQLSLFPLDTLEEAARLPDGGVRSQAFSGPVLALCEDLSDASGTDIVEPHYPASPLEPMVMRSTAPGDDGTEWRAVFMPRRTAEDGRPVREPEDVSRYRLEPIGPGVRAGAKRLAQEVATGDVESISFIGPDGEKTTITKEEAPQIIDELEDPPIAYGDDVSEDEAPEQSEGADEHWEADEQSQAEPQPMARRRPSRPSKLPERAKPPKNTATQGPKKRKGRRA